MTETGDFCDKTIDICDIIACYPGVACDNRSGSANPCGPCPVGLVGSGIVCEGITFLFKKYFFLTRELSLINTYCLEGRSRNINSRRRKPE